MNRKDMVIATITWARNKMEEALLRESLTRLSTLSMPVYITDGGSEETFLEFVRSIPNFTLLPPVKGLWAQAKNSLLHAYEADSKFVFYTEPDKTDFFGQGLPAMLDTIHCDEQTGIYLASRSAKAFASFPRFQQMTEATINGCCSEVIGEKLDYVYGPFLMNRKLIPYIKDLNKENIGWGWRPYVFNIARRLGYRIESFVGDFLCPEDQQHDDAQERIYRMKQLTQNIEGLVLSTTVVLSA